MDDLSETTNAETTEQPTLFEGDTPSESSTEEHENKGDDEGAGEASTGGEAAPETVEAPVEEVTTSEAATVEVAAEVAAEATVEAPVEAPPAKPVTRTVPTTRHLRAELPHKEKSRMFDEVMDLEEQIKDTKKAKDHANEKYKDKLDSLSAKRLELVELGKEGRKVDVLCDMIFDYTNEKITVIRKDTGETLESRTMTKDERQGTLEFGSTDRKVETVGGLAVVTDLAAAGVPNVAPKAEGAEVVEPPADEWVVEWIDKETGKSGVSQVGDLGLLGVRDRTFASPFEAEEWAESQRAIYGTTTEYVSKPRAIAVAAPVAVEEAPIEAPAKFVVVALHDDETRSLCVDEEGKTALFPSEAAAQLYADEMGSHHLKAKYVVEVYVPAPVLADEDDEGDMGIILETGEPEGGPLPPAPKKRAKSTRKKRSNAKSKGAKAAEV